MALRAPEDDAAHWRKTRNLAVAVLVVWAVFALLVPWLAGWLNAVTIAGFPLGWWLTAQGSLIVFVLLAFYLDWRQTSIDRHHGLED